MKRFAVITGGGLGTRLNNTLPKQFLCLKGTPVIMLTIQQFVPFCDKIIVSLPENYHDYWIKLQAKYHFFIPHVLVSGGVTRFESVKNALEYISDEGWVAIHDAVRPFVSEILIEKCFVEANKYGNAVSSLPMTESVRMIDEQGKNKSIDRNAFFKIQTPQVFRCNEIKKAYRQDYQSVFTDDAAVLESAGYAIHLTKGEEQNLKITTPTDFLFAETLAMKLGKSLF